MKAILDYFQPDVLYSYTALYTWTSNQTAHTLLGFFLASFLGVRFPDSRKWILWAFAVPVLKEIADTSLYVLSSNSREGVIPIPWIPIILDNLTDIYFWSWGIVMGIGAVLPAARNKRWLIVLGALVLGALLSFPVSTGWIAAKKSLDESNLPQNYVTLTRFPGKYLKGGGVAVVKKFIERVAIPPTSTMHLVVEGMRPMDRSALAIAIGVEFTENVKPVHWISAVKMLDDPQLISEIFLKQNNCQCVVIDDLSVNLPIPSALLEEPFDSTSLRTLLGEASDRVSAKKLSYIRAEPAVSPPDVSSAEDAVANIWKEILTHFQANQTTSFVWVLADSPSPGRANWVKLINKLAHAMGGGEQSVQYVELDSENIPIR